MEDYDPSFAEVLFAVMLCVKLGNEMDRKGTREKMLFPTPATSLQGLSDAYIIWRSNLARAAMLGESYVSDLRRIPDALELLSSTCIK